MFLFSKGIHARAAEAVQSAEALILGHEIFLVVGLVVVLVMAARCPSDVPVSSGRGLGRQL